MSRAPRWLTVLAPERAATLPQVPASAEAGMPEVVVITWYGLLAPVGVKPAIIGRLNAEVAKVAKVMNTPETENKLAQIRLRIPYPPVRLPGFLAAASLSGDRSFRILAFAQELPNYQWQQDNSNYYKSGYLDVQPRRTT